MVEQRDEPRKHGSSSATMQTASIQLQDFILFNFNLSIVDLQNCAHFCCMAKSVIHIYIIFHILFNYGLSQDTEHNSQCYTVGHGVLPFCIY